MLDKYFEYKKHKTTFRTEVIAGVTTFLTMAYIMFLNPFILSGEFGGPEKGFFEFGGVYTATIVATATACFIMAFYGRSWPIGLAPGMGINAFVAFGVVAGRTNRGERIAVFLIQNVIESPGAGANRIQRRLQTACGHGGVLINHDMTMLRLDQMQLVNIAFAVGAKDIRQVCLGTFVNDNLIPDAGFFQNLLNRHQACRMLWMIFSGVMTKMLMKRVVACRHEMLFLLFFSVYLGARLSPTQPKDHISWARDRWNPSSDPKL